MRVRTLLYVETLLGFVCGLAVLSLPYLTTVYVYGGVLMLGLVGLSFGLAACKVGWRKGLLLVDASAVLALLSIFFMMVSLVKFSA